MIKLEAVIFDMDGVIFDSETLVIRTWKQVADKYGIPDVEKVCMQCLGTNHEATVKIFQKHYGQQMAGFRKNRESVSYWSF